jgi:hypothetical protein
VIRAFVQVAWEATAGVNPAGVHVDVLDGALAAVCTVVDGASLKKNTVLLLDNDNTHKGHKK